MNSMLRLTNIKATSEYIEAHYTPEDSTEKGFVRLNDKAEVVDSIAVKGYEKTYPLMASKALKKLSDSLKSNPNYELPKEKVIMWY